MKNNYSIAERNRIVEEHLWCIDRVIRKNRSLMRAARLDYDDVYSRNWKLSPHPFYSGVVLKLSSRRSRWNDTTFWLRSAAFSGRKKSCTSWLHPPP